MWVGISRNFIKVLMKFYGKLKELLKKKKNSNLWKRF